MKHFIKKLSLLFLLIIFWLSPLTNSNYYDTETSSGNTISASCWDTTAPIISSVSHLVATLEESNDTKATISWITNEDADSNLYWTIDNVTWDTVSDLSFVTNHSLEIFGLSTDTTYYYYVTSSDQAGNTTASSTHSFDTDSMTPEDFTPTTDIVINEFLINPIGADDASMPGGEWVELYNNSTTPYDLTGWSINAYTSDYRLHLTTTNTVSSDLSTSGLTIGPYEFFVVYRNSSSSFYMRNTADDGIKLYNASDVCVDQYMYTASQVIENKSIARYPDGSDTWFDPIPTPLGPNILESYQSVVVTPDIELNIYPDKTKADFKVADIDSYIKVNYEFTYDTDNGLQGVIGEQELNSQSFFEKTGITLGTCSAGGTCTYHQNPINFKLKIDLTDKNGQIKNLEKSL